MKISDLAASSAQPITEIPSATHSRPSSDDIAWFSAALEQPESSAVPTAHQPGQNALFSKASSMFNQLDEDKKNVDKVLHNASRSTDPLVLTKVDGQLSNYYLESALNAKIVSKSVQGLEKLTNLQ